MLIHPVLEVEPVQVIRVKIVLGDGSPHNKYKHVIQYWTMEGKPIAGFEERMNSETPEPDQSSVPCISNKPLTL